MSPEERQLIERLELSESRLSRTRTGKSDTRASKSKRPLLLSGEALALRSAANAQNLHRLLLELSKLSAPACVEQLAETLRRIEDTVNDGLLPGGRYREWELSYADAGADFSRKIPQVEVAQAMESFVQELFWRWSSLPVQAVEVAAWAEWTIQGPIHPYYDGCGRISRAISTWILLWSGQTVPVYTSREDWFRHALMGLGPFTDYFRICLSTQSTTSQDS